MPGLSQKGLASVPPLIPVAQQPSEATIIEVDMSDSPSGEYPQSLPRPVTPFEDIQPSSPVNNHHSLLKYVASPSLYILLRFVSA